jgi:excisionase family DNA binding protein
MKTFFMKTADGVFMAPRQPNSAAKATPKASPLSTATVTSRRPTTIAVGADEEVGSDEEIEQDPKKRVRLKPESRDQLLERLRNPQLSLHEASILLRVSRATVRRYADSSRLPCQRTPGGQRRFFLRDIEMFYRQLKTKR